MISQKRFSSSVIDGTLTRFLSDFIIPTEQHVRVYNYVYDPINGSDISDILDPGGSGLYVRETDNPTSADLIGLDKWDLVTNSILFYTPPYATSSLVLEVATNPEDFGFTLVQPSIARAEEAAVASALSAIESADSAAEALASEDVTAADVVLTHADVVLTGLDVDATNADVVLTGLDVDATNADVVLTHADVVLTGLDLVATNADVVLTGLDLVATNADVVLTGLDVDATNADVVLTNADVVLTNADVVLTGLDVVSSATNATNAQLEAWIAEAEAMTAESNASEAVSVLTKTYTSLGNGSFSSVNNTWYSAFHYATTIVPGITEVGSSYNLAGYVNLDNGMILQWGRQTANNGTVYNVVYPIAFPTACRNITTSVAYPGDLHNTATPYLHTSYVNNGTYKAYFRFRMWTHTSPTYVFWFAIGN